MAVAYNTNHDITTTATEVGQLYGGQTWTIGNTGGSIVFVLFLGASETLPAAFTGTEAQLRAMASAEVGPFQRCIVPAGAHRCAVATGTGHKSTIVVAAGVQDAPLPAYTSVAVNAAKNGTRDIVATPGADKQLWVYGFTGTSDAAGHVTWLDSTPTSHSGVMPVPALGGVPLGHLNPQAPWFKCATNKILQVTLPVGNDLDGILIYATVTV
jgi:hypothetical protein